MRRGGSPDGFQVAGFSLPLTEAASTYLHRLTPGADFRVGSRGETKRERETEMAEHTPGPWTIDEDADINIMGEVVSISILDSNGDSVGEADARDLGRSEAEANARLIAAAPDLLAAIRRIEIWLTNQPLDQLSKHEMLREARAAIVKAEAA